MCSVSKNPYTPHGRSWEILRSGGLKRKNNFKSKLFCHILKYKISESVLCCYPIYNKEIFENEPVAK